ncbi:MAG: hypothetical protein NTY94_00400 [Alphaproteobacteria bacterium]|nr:hypothetical protein [Alphaproteobacteria bacterium]
MSQPTGPSRLAEIRALNRHLVSAQDAKILKVVAMVDALPHRGEADSLIEPLRARLAQLRPGRPLAVGRLLFMPLDPVLVAAPQWQRGALTVPRTVVPCLIRQVTAMDPALMADIGAQVAGGRTDDLPLILRAGPRLWARAAELLTDSRPPADWVDATGLQLADHAALRRMVVSVLRQAPAIARQVPRNPPNRVAIGELLTEAAAEPETLGVLISVMMQWIPSAAAMILSITSAHASPTGLPGRTATERAVEHVLDTIEADPVVAPDGAPGLDKLRRTVAMLDELSEGSADRPARSARITATRARIDTTCRSHFETSLQARVLAPLAAPLPQQAEASEALEDAARDLRRFEQVARRINNSDAYDRMLRSTGPLLSPRPGDDAQSRVDRLRLAEILLGPEQALQMLVEAEKEVA